MTTRRPWQHTSALSWPLVATLCAGCATVYAGCASQGAALQLVVPADQRDADLWIDGNYVGTVEQAATPGAIELPRGTHRVELRKPGYLPSQQLVQVPDRRTREVQVDASLLQDAL